MNEGSKKQEARSEGGRRPSRAQEKTRERLEEEEEQTKTDTERLRRQVEILALAHTYLRIIDI